MGLRASTQDDLGPILDLVSEGFLGLPVSGVQFDMEQQILSVTLLDHGQEGVGRPGATERRPKYELLLEGVERIEVDDPNEIELYDFGDLSYDESKQLWTLRGRPDLHITAHATALRCELREAV